MAGSAAVCWPVQGETDGVCSHGDSCKALACTPHSRLGAVPRPQLASAFIRQAVLHTVCLLLHLFTSCTCASCTCPTSTPVLRQQNCVRRRPAGARFILLVEKDAVFQSLVESRLHEQLPCVIITGGARAACDGARVAETRPPQVGRG